MISVTYKEPVLGRKWHLHFVRLVFLQEDKYLSRGVASASRLSVISQFVDMLRLFKSMILLFLAASAAVAEYPNPGSCSGYCALTSLFQSYWEE